MRYSAIIMVGGLILVIVSGYFFVRWSFNFAERQLAQNVSEFQASQLEHLERHMNRSLDEAIRDLLAKHDSCKAVRPNDMPSQSIKSLFRQLNDDSRFQAVAYISADARVLAVAPKVKRTANVGFLTGGVKNKDLLDAIKQMEKDENHCQFSSILSGEPGAGWGFDILIPISAGRSEKDKADGDGRPIIKKSKPRFLATRMDLANFLQKIDVLTLDKNLTFWVLDTKGNILYHQIVSLAGTNLLDYSQLEKSEREFLNKAMASESHRGRYVQRFFDSQESAESVFAVSRRVTIGKSPATFILSTPTKTKSAHLMVAVRGLIIALLVLFLVILILGQVWQVFKRKEIEVASKGQLTKELEKMVEARTVELNFVTRTIKDLIDSIPSALIVLDRRLNVLLVNLSFYSIFSSRLVNVTGRNVTEIFSEDFRDRLQKIVKTKEPIIDLEMRKYVEGQGEKALLINALHLLGKRNRLLLVIDDISERKILERQLIQAEKMAGLGTLMSGIAHEINNPLNAIAGISQIILARSKDEEVSNDARQIVRYVKRVAEIIKELSRYSRSTKVTDTATTDIHSIIEGAIGMVRHSRKMKEVQLEKNFAHDLPAIKVNVVETEQVFINLFSNAIDALESKTHTDGDPTKKLSISTELYSNEFVQIVIEDNGTGIAPENLKSVFDPFFSTKEQSKGTGLGLSISYKIVQRYGGIILVDSQVGIGTKFTIRIPINQ